MRRPIRYLLFVALLLVPLLVHYWPFLFGGRCYASSDHHLFFEPFCRFIGESYRNGRLPLWNPYLYFGMAQYALPSPSFLYPPTLLYAVQTYSQGLSTQQIIHHIAAATGGALLAESLGLSFAAAACAGMTYAFCGYMFTLSANYSLVAGVAWLPFALFSSRRIRFASTVSNRSFWIILLSLFIFLMVSAGRPEVFVPVIVIVCAHALTSIGRHYLLKFKANWVNKADSENVDPADSIKDKHTLKLFFYRMFALAIGICLCMPLLLPAMEWSSMSTRAKGLDPQEVMIWSANWYSFVTVLLAQPFGDLQTLGNTFLPVAADRASYMPFLPSGYVGAAVITLAIFGIFHTRSPWLLPVAMLLLVGTTFSLGRYTPVLAWLIHNVSSLAVFRYPVKLLILPIMAVCLLSAFGMQAASENRIGKFALRTMAIVWLVVMLGGLSTVLIGKHWSTIQSVKLSLSCEVAIAIGIAIFHSAAIGLTMTVICILRSKNMLGRFGFAAFTCALIYFDLLGTAMRFPPLSADSAFINNKPILVSMLEKQVGDKNVSKARILNMYYDPLSIPQPLFQGGPAERTLRYYRYCRDLLVCNSNVDYKVHEAYGYEGTLLAKYRHLTLGLINDVRNASGDDASNRGEKIGGDAIYDERMRRYAAATGLQFVSCQIFRDGEKQPLLNNDDFEIVDEDHNVNLRLYKVRKPSPRAELVSQWTWVDSAERAFRILHVQENEQKDAVMPLIEKGGALRNDYPRGFITANTPRTSICEILADKPEQVTVSVNTSHPSMLILRDQFYPGWKAYLDSVSVPIYRANGFTRAVFIPQGSHAVEFYFRPTSLKRGAMLALGALIVLAVLSIIAIGPSFWRFVKWTAGQK